MRIGKSGGWQTWCHQVTNRVVALVFLSHLSNFSVEQKWSHPKAEGSQKNSAKRAHFQTELARTVLRFCGERKRILQASTIKRKLRFPVYIMSDYETCNLFHCQYALVNFICALYGSGWSVEVGHKARGAFHISHLSLWSPRNNEAENRQSMDDVYNLVIITGQQQLGPSFWSNCTFSNTVKILSTSFIAQANDVVKISNSS